MGVGLIPFRQRSGGERTIIMLLASRQGKEMAPRRVNARETTDWTAHPHRDAPPATLQLSPACLRNPAFCHAFLSMDARASPVLSRAGVASARPCMDCAEMVPAAQYKRVMPRGGSRGLQILPPVNRLSPCFASPIFTVGLSASVGIRGN